MFAKAFKRLNTGNPFEAPAEPARDRPFAPSFQAAAPTPLRSGPVFKPAEPQPQPNAAQQALWAKAESVLEAQRKWLSGFNKTLPNGCTVVAYPLIPPGIWWREHGDFLMQAFEFYPASLGNTALATMDPVSARMLNLPLAPRIPNRLLEDSTHQRLAQLRQRFATEHENMAMAFARGDFTGLGSSVGRKARYGRELIEIANSIGFATFGKQAWLTHERAFFSALGQRKI